MPRSRRTASVILYDGDDYAALNAALEKVYAAEADDERAKGTRRSGDIFNAANARKEYDALEAEAAGRAERATVGTVGRKQWRALREQHKPRPGNEQDDELGYDGDAFPDAVVAACLVEPEFTNSHDRDEWLDELTEGEAMALFMAAFGLNEEMPDPKVSRPAGPRP